MGEGVRVGYWRFLALVMRLMCLAVAATTALSPSAVVLTFAAFGMAAVTLLGPALERIVPLAPPRDNRIDILRDAYATDKIEMDGPLGFEEQVAYVLADPEYRPSITSLARATTLLREPVRPKADPTTRVWR